MPHIPSYYQVLEVNQDATEDMIKKSYRKLAKQYHPDKTYDSLRPAEKKIFDIIKAKIDKRKPLSELEKNQYDHLNEKLNKKFQQISTAYETLSDNTKRAEYDRKRLGHTNSSRNNFSQPTADCKINDFRASIILGNLERCRSLIEDHNINVNLKFGDSKTPVEVAIEGDKFEILGLLISKGANISPSNDLSYAVKYSANKVFSFLLEKCRIRINSKNENRETVLHRILKYCGPNGLSALYKYKSFIEQLLDAGAKLDVKNKDNLTPFDILIDYVENGLSEFNRTQKLNFVSELLSRYRIEKLEKLKYKDGTLAVNKLMKLAVKCNSKEVIVPIGELFINLIDRKDSHILQLEKENDNLNSIIRELDKTRVELAEKKRKIEQKLTRDNLSFTDKLHQLQNNLNELDVQVAQLAREKSRLQGTLKNKQTILDEKDSQIKSLNEKLESKNRELHDIQQQILSLKSKNEGKIKALHEQLENKSELENRIKKLQKQLANKGELKSQITELQKQLESKGNEVQDLPDKNKKPSAASIQGVKGKVNYIPIVFILSIASAVGASLTIPYLTVCIMLTAVALAFLVVGCCYSYKAKTALENVEVNQQQNCQRVA